MNKLEKAALERAIHVWGEDATADELVCSQMDFVAGVEWEREGARKRCKCGGVILADTEDWTSPLCPNCYEEAHRHFTAKHKLFEDYETEIDGLEKENKEMLQQVCDLTDRLNFELENAAKLLRERDQRIDELKFQLADLATENKRLKKQLAVAVDGLKRIDKQRFLLGRDFMPYDVAVLTLKQIEEMGK